MWTRPDSRASDRPSAEPVLQSPQGVTQHPTSGTKPSPLSSLEPQLPGTPRPELAPSPLSTLSPLLQVWLISQSSLSKLKQTILEQRSVRDEEDAASSHLNLPSTHHLSREEETLHSAVLVGIHLASPPGGSLAGPDKGGEGSKALHIKSFIKARTFTSFNFGRHTAPHW